MPDSPRRDELLRCAFSLTEAMLLDGDEGVKDLAYIGLLEARGAWWWRRAQPFMGPASQRALDEHEPSWRIETHPAPAESAQCIDLYVVRGIIARELAAEGIARDRVPGTTHKEQLKPSEDKKRR